jgi:hypothetical protein
VRRAVFVGKMMFLALTHSAAGIESGRSVAQTSASQAERFNFRFGCV